MNKDAAITQANLNRINQYTPQGNITYSQTGTNTDGTPQWSQTQTLSPDEQAKYDQNNKVALALNNLAINNVSRVQDVQSKPFSYDGMTPMVTSIGEDLPAINYGPRSGYATATGVGDTGRVSDMQPGMGGRVSDMPFGMGGRVQGGLDYGNLTALPGVDDFSADARRVSDAVYGQATSRLDPRYQQGESDMRSRLAAQGISENSDAYRRELDNFNRDRADSYNQAAYAAQQAGSAEQSRIFGLAMGARQQGQNEVNTQGAFANQAQAQRFGQGAQTVQQNNASQQQRFTQGAQTVQQNNQAQDQRYQQALAAAELFNQSQQQRFSQDQSTAAFGNQARTQQYNEQAANATLNNSARQQQISEATYLRNLPLNEIAALLGTGSPVANPSFQPVSQVGVAAPDYQGIVQNNYNQAMQTWQQQQQARSSGLGSIFGLAGTVATAFSDARLKRNIVRVGTLANGLATYTYNYVGSKTRQFGVMAQEALHIVPEAVGRLANGIMYVNYAKVF